MQEKREKILTEILKIVPFDGWTSKSLEEATVNAGFAPKYSSIAFPNGVIEVVDMFLRNLDQQMLKKLENKSTDKLSIRKKIALAVRTRLEIAEQHKNVIRKTVAFYALPFNSIESLKSVWKTVDSIWYMAGDTATDYNHYTKRATLAAVYSSTLLYWLGDRSEKHSNTWDFLDRRIENVIEFEKCKSKAKEFFNKVTPLNG